MRLQCLPPTIVVLFLTGCAGIGDSASESLKSRLVEREANSLVRQASARIQCSQMEMQGGFVEAPLPEPDLASPVDELVPWKD